MQEALLGTAGLLVAGAITPGPNNFVVLREAARAGWRGVLPPIVGIVSGGLTLLLLSAFGIGTVTTALPGLEIGVAVLGCLYLTFLGLRLLGSRPTDETEDRAGAPLPAGVWGLFVFQFLNPKAWLLIVTITATAQAELGVLNAIQPLVVLFVVVSVICLGLWSWAGVCLNRVLENETAGVWFDRATGLILVVCAVYLLAATWR